MGGDGGETGHPQTPHLSDSSITLQNSAACSATTTSAATAACHSREKGAEERGGRWRGRGSGFGGAAPHPIASPHLLCCPHHGRHVLRERGSASAPIPAPIPTCTRASPSPHRLEAGRGEVAVAIHRPPRRHLCPPGSASGPAFWGWAEAGNGGRGGRRPGPEGSLLLAAGPGAAAGALRALPAGSGGRAAGRPR